MLSSSCKYTTVTRLYVIDHTFDLHGQFGCSKDQHAHTMGLHNPAACRKKYSHIIHSNNTCKIGQGQIKKGCKQKKNKIVLHTENALVAIAIAVSNTLLIHTTISNTLPLLVETWFLYWMELGRYLWRHRTHAAFLKHQQRLAGTQT